MVNLKSDKYVCYKQFVPNQYLYYKGDDQYTPDIRDAIILGNENYAIAIADKKGIKYLKLS